MNPKRRELTTAVEDMLEITGPSHAAYKAQMVSIRECITPGMTYDDVSGRIARDVRLRADGSILQAM